MDKGVVEPVVSWFSLSLIISGIAQSMNRSGFLWWLFAIFTGPVALFFLVVFAGKVEPKASSSDKNEV